MRRRLTRPGCSSCSPAPASADVVKQAPPGRVRLAPRRRPLDHRRDALPDEPQLHGPARPRLPRERVPADEAGGRGARARAEGRAGAGLHAQGLRLLPAAALGRRLRQVGQGPLGPADEGRVLPARAQEPGVQGGLHRHPVRPQPRRARWTSRSSSARRGKQERYHRGDRLRDCGGPRSTRFRDNTIDMGTGYDCFDPLAHPYATRFRGTNAAPQPPQRYASRCSPRASSRSPPSGGTSR